MRRRDKEISDRAWIDEVLHAARVVRVAMCDGGRPYVVPVCFAYDGTCIYVHSAPEGRKIDILRRNPKVCFEVSADIDVRPGTSPCSWSMDYKCVMGEGTAVFLEDEHDKRRALEAIIERYTQSPGHAKRIDTVTVIRIDIASLSAKHSKGAP